ncbi:hypothetical protein CP532_2582 [Ophiocordyceps camponoti-leonardi (nom. inval.)]|nr:hypothetical protein CP532_2582 [Ophiocordyceps camponoti-leonardi (nom. inval.)]
MFAPTTLITTLLIAASFVKPRLTNEYDSAASPWELACTNLGAIFPASTFFRWSKGYSAMSDINWSATARAKPGCIIRPENTTQVQSIARLLSRRRVPFAIRSGGHNPAPGAANINDGVLIDLGLLNDVVYTPGSNTVTVGTGAKWTKVYTVLDRHGVTVVGGRILDVGVGGLLLGSKWFGTLDVGKTLNLFFTC